MGKPVRYPLRTKSGKSQAIQSPWGMEDSVGLGGTRMEASTLDARVADSSSGRNMQEHDP